MCQPPNERNSNEYYHDHRMRFNLLGSLRSRFAHYGAGEEMTDPTLQAMIDLLADKDTRERNRLITALAFSVSKDEPEMRRIAANIKWRSADKKHGPLSNRAMKVA